MLKFFNNIRKSLITEGKTINYLKYAFGEIILVVFGILIALQVNEWNNERNRNKQVTVIVNQLKDDLRKSSIEMDTLIADFRENGKASAIVCKQFWKNEIPGDTIFIIMYQPLGTQTYSPNLGNLRSLINTGDINLFKSVALKNYLTSYMEKVSYLLSDINRYEETYYRGARKIFTENSILGLYSERQIRARLKQRNKASNLSARDDFNTMPEQVEKIPFKANLNKLFEDKHVYMAYRNLLVYNRNVFFKYTEIQKLTKNLLKELEKPI